VNLAGVVTFVGQGIHPHRLSEARRARRSTSIAVGVWTTLLAGLVLLLLVAKR
jgi:hypothetical protein